MKTYFVEIAVVESAAKMLGVSLVDNYAALGALKKFRDRELGEVVPIKGLEDIEEKAESFRFGCFCGRVLADCVGELTEKEQLAYEARTAGVFWHVQDVADVAEEARKETLKIALQAYVKRAQIRTHTAKPGSENINLWLNSYNRMQQDYKDSLDGFVRAVVTPDEEEEKRGSAFLNEEDAVVKLVLTGDMTKLQEALSEPATCLFGEVLRKIAEEKMRQQ